MLRWEHKHTFLIIVIIAIICGIITYQKPLKLGLDLRGGAHLVYLLKETEEIKEINRDIVMQTVDVIRKRIDLKGEFEAIIQPQGDDRIIVELPAVKDLEKAVRYIGTTAHLEFKCEEGKTILTGADLKKAEVGFDHLNIPRVLIEFDRPTGARKFATFTTRNIGRTLSIALDGEVISSPEIREPILGGNAEISGDFTVKEAQDLANLLQGGALPVPLERVEERTVGPSLGEDSVQKGLKAGIIGFACVFLFMILYYRLLGVVACIALSFYLLFIITIFEGIPITLTFPGIAAFILSIGMAVDANILIFERLKEELRTDKTIKSAIDTAFSRAFPSIFDSNVTTLISCAVLYYFGSGPIKGFALALSVGILASMFTAIVISKTLLHLIIGAKFAKNPFLLGVSKEIPFMLRKNFELTNNRRYWFTLSLVIVVLGLIFLFPAAGFRHFPPKTGLNLGVDFTGGSLLQVKFKEDMEVADIRDILSKAEMGIEKSSIQQLTEKESIIRCKFLTPEERIKLDDIFEINKGEILRVEAVGPIIGRELTNRAILSILIASLLIIIYLAVRFNQIRYGFCAIIALLHDTVVVTGMFAILGKLLGVEVDSLFVTAILIIIGFSVNDTVVVYDRIRENLKLKKAQDSLDNVVNFSLLQTFPRSVNTTFTTLMPAMALLLFAGPVLKHFNVAMLIGIIIGTYSSIFNAAQLIVAWERFIKKERIKPKLKEAQVLKTKPVMQISQETTSTQQVKKNMQKKKKGKQRRR